MIQGHVSIRNEVIVRLAIEAANHAVFELDAIVDTGFNGVVSLPAATCTALSLRADGIRNAELADGSRVVVEVVKATICWNGQRVGIEIVTIEGSPLIGTALLRGHSLYAEFKEGGPVRVEALT